MSREELALHYAHALYEMCLEEWSSWLDVVQQHLSADPALAELFASGTVPLAEKQKRLSATAPESASPKFRQFLAFLVGKGHVEHLPDIIGSFGRVAKRGPAVQLAYVTSAVELTDAEKVQLQHRLNERFGAELECEYRVDPALFGGVRVRVGDMVIDGSVSGRLEALRSRLLSAT